MTLADRADHGVGGWGPNSSPSALCISGSTIYVAVETPSSGKAQIYKATLPGGNWSSVGPELSAVGIGTGTSAKVNAIACDGSYVYVGGFFSQAVIAGGTDIPLKSLARISISGSPGYAEIGGGIKRVANADIGYVSALALLPQPTGNYLFVGGRFVQAGTIGCMNIARYHTYDSNPSAWNAMDGGVASTDQNNQSNIGLLNCILPTQDTIGGLQTVYVGGSFKRWMTYESKYTTNVAIWKNSGGYWTGTGNGCDNIDHGGIGATVYALTQNTEVYVGGSFPEHSYTSASSAKISTGLVLQKWSNYGFASGSVYISALASLDQNVYVCGGYDSITNSNGHVELDAKGFSVFNRTTGNSTKIAPPLGLDDFYSVHAQGMASHPSYGIFMIQTSYPGGIIRYIP